MPRRKTFGATAVGGAVCPPGKWEGSLALKHYMEMGVLRARIPDTILTCGWLWVGVSFYVTERPGPHRVKHLSTLFLPQCLC